MTRINDLYSNGTDSQDKIIMFHIKCISFESLCFLAVWLGALRFLHDDYGEFWWTFWSKWIFNTADKELKTYPTRFFFPSIKTFCQGHVSPNPYRQTIPDDHNQMHHHDTTASLRNGSLNKRWSCIGELCYQNLCQTKGNILHCKISADDMYQRHSFYIEYTASDLSMTCFVIATKFHAIQPAALQARIKE